MSSVKLPFIQEAKKSIAAKMSVINVVTFEDQRCANQLKELAARGFKQPMPFYSWTQSQGLQDPQGEKVPDTASPEKMLDFVLAQTQPSLFVLLDFVPMLSNNPLVIRKLRDVYQQAKQGHTCIFYTSTSPTIPQEMTKEISILDFPLPSPQDLEKALEQSLKGFGRTLQELDVTDKEDLIKSAMGLTWDEAIHAYQKAFMGRKVIDRECIKVVIEEKCKVVRKDGILEYIDIDFGMQEIGGLQNLKDWLTAREHFFSKDAVAHGITPPKGILLTGISGCGKSSCVKAISKYWRLPLMRLDMTKVYGGTIGNPEETMRRVLQTVEAVAPVILWIEEIEKGVAGFAQGDGGVTARIFSSFLTWMQEKTAQVFVAATANEIDKLPPELLRKGRFDEIFFTDLPTEAERTDIFKVHIQKRQQDPTTFKLDQLAKSTVNFSGAEIEQVVASGLFHAYNEKRPFNDQDLYREISRTIPLATTMSEQIKVIKRWADTRAVKASK